MKQHTQTSPSFAIGQRVRDKITGNIYTVTGDGVLTNHVAIRLEVPSANGQLAEEFHVAYLEPVEISASRKAKSGRVPTITEFVESCHAVGKNPADALRALTSHGNSVEPMPAVCAVGTCGEFARWRVQTHGHPNGDLNARYCTRHAFVPTWEESPTIYTVTVTGPLRVGGGDNA